MNKKVLILSGGTGGHVIPAVNFGNYLINKKYICSIISDKRGKKFLNNFNGNVKIINSSHLSGNFFFKILGIIKLISGFFESIIYIVKDKPSIVISFGSYAALPPALIIIFIKKILHIKFYIHEQNSIIGRSNRFLLNFSEKVFLNYNIDFSPNDKNIKRFYHVGLPDNSSKNNISNEDYDMIDKKNFNIFLYGGSQGSKYLIEYLESLIKKIEPRLIKKFFFIVQCPNNYRSKIIKELNTYNCKYFIKDFFNNIENILVKTNLIISRAGAGTINDIIKYKIPAALIPLPTAKDNHQYENTKLLINAKCAIVINENKDEVLKTINFINKIADNKDSYISTKNNFLKIKTPNANKLMLDLIENE